MKVLKDAYYYAGDKRIPLERDNEFVAVDTSQLERAELPYKLRLKVNKFSRPIRQDLSLVKCKDLTNKLRERLEEEGVLQPVYQYEDSHIVVLPEIRAEDASAAMRAKIRNWVTTHKSLAKIVKELGNQVILKPVSGSGSDALELANQIHEELVPEMVQARMVRILPKPR